MLGGSAGGFLPLDVMKTVSYPFASRTSRGPISSSPQYPHWERTTRILLIAFTPHGLLAGTEPDRTTRLIILAPLQPGAAVFMYQRPDRNRSRPLQPNASKGLMRFFGPSTEGGTNPPFASLHT